MNTFGNSSPLSSKKLEPQSHKVSLNDVHEGLKAMRQKRLSRLSTFVAEQTRLCETRSLSKERESDGSQENHRLLAENYIQSSFGAISEESDVRNSVNWTENDTKVSAKEKSIQQTFKSSPKKKFLNKLNCVISKINFSSSEDEPEEGYNSDESKNVGNIEKTNLHALRQSENCDKNAILKLSQRKPIYFSEKFDLNVLPSESSNENQFSSLPKDIKQADRIMTITGEKALSKELQSIGSSESITRKPEPTFLVSVNKEIDKKISSLSQEKNVFGVNKTDEFKLKYSKDVKTESVEELQKKTFNLSKEEKILKKLQMNYVTVNKLLRSESDGDYHIDSDEMEDFKNTLDDAKNLLVDYEIKIKDLKQKLPIRKLNNIKRNLEDIRRQIDSFRGLRRDISYNDIFNRITFYQEELYLFGDEIKEKLEISEYVKLCFILLEDKVNTNETILRSILEQLVDIISRRRIKETYL